MTRRARLVHFQFDDCVVDTLDAPDMAPLRHFGTGVDSDGTSPATIVAWGPFPFLPQVASGSYLASMRVVGLKVLKNRLSEYVRIAAAGERVLVTDRDRVVAELGPPSAGAPAFAADALLAEAVRSGWLRPPVLPGGSIPPRLPIASLQEVLEGLDADRAER